MKTLDEWLQYQQRIHARGIELGLERVREVWRRMGAPRPAPVVITVGGTNGKGSTVAFLEAMLRAGGMRVGAYTSPHILRYNERVRIDGAEAADDALVAAFGRIETARGETSLTYFEFGTLAAFDVFAKAGLDVALLEVGLGGRLDAVNIIDADCAIVTTVDLDHMEYLGNDRELIGREKAGIFRADKPAIAGESDPPRSLVEHARNLGARLEVFGRDFGWTPQADGLQWWHRGARDPAAGSSQQADAPIALRGALALEGAFQYHNAAAAIAALRALGDRVRWDPSALVKPVQADAPLLAGRLQRIAGCPDLIVDVAHNPQAARALALWLDRHPAKGVTHAVFGALGDKDIEGIAAALGPRIAHWHLAGLEAESPRGASVCELSARVRRALPGASCSEHPDVVTALSAACDAARTGDRILAFGSFFVVASVLRACRV